MDSHIKTADGGFYDGFSKDVTITARILQLFVVFHDVCAGIGIGMLTFATAEPMIHFSINH